MVRFDGDAREADELSIRRMTDALRHRGPDGSGTLRRGPAVIGHRRLSIIDLSEAGRQPMSNEDGTIWLAFNGEIYNFRQLRPELEGRGHCFRSQTDSEVILHGYEEWGITDLLPRLRGMFAFALLDARAEEWVVHLARDRYGIKPLYYFSDPRICVFGSEVRALPASGLVPRERNREAASRFLQTGSIPEPMTVLRGVFSVPAGGHCRIRGRDLSVHSYFSLERTLQAPNSAAGSPSFEEAAEATREALEESVRLHLVSDVPLGVFLSGGVDSSALAALAARERTTPLITVSVVFEEADFSEARYIRLMADRLSSDHREVTLRAADFAEGLSAAIESMDQPTVDGLNTYFVAKAARQAGLTVVLSGLGADEVFWGYRHFKSAWTLRRLWPLFSALPRRGRAALAALAARASRLGGRAALAKSAYLENGRPGDFHLLYRGLFPPAQIQTLLGLDSTTVREMNREGPSGSGLLPGLTVAEWEGYLRNQLLRDTDSMSMAHSLEVRVPYLDHVLVERVFAMPPHLKFDAKINKPLLVAALGGDLPREVWDRPKMGFTLPMDRWLRIHRERCESETLDSDMLDGQAVQRVWRDFASGRAHWSLPWSLFVASRCLA